VVEIYDDFARPLMVRDIEMKPCFQKWKQFSEFPNTPVHLQRFCRMCEKNGVSP
jgi:hypothetical protein